SLTTSDDPLWSDGRPQKLPVVTWLEERACPREGEIMDSRPTSGPVEVFDTIGEASLAWFFAMANWNLPSDKPSFQVRAGSKIIFCASSGNLAELGRLIRRAMLRGGSLAESARVLRIEFQDRGFDLSEPAGEDRAGSETAPGDTAAAS